MQAIRARRKLAHRVREDSGRLTKPNSKEKRVGHGVAGRVKFLDDDAGARRERTSDREVHCFVGDAKRGSIVDPAAYVETAAGASKVSTMEFHVASARDRPELARIMRCRIGERADGRATPRRRRATRVETQRRRNWSVRDERLIPVSAAVQKSGAEQSVRTAYVSDEFHLRADSVDRRPGRLRTRGRDDHAEDHQGEYDRCDG